MPGGYNGPLLQYTGPQVPSQKPHIAGIIHLRLLEKQKLEKELRNLFKQLQKEGPQGLTEERFNQALSGVLERRELVNKGSEHRIVSILIADLRGFTYIVEKVSAAKIINILNEYFSAMVAIIDLHGGHVNKFMGDSVIAYFDCPENESDSILKVLRCAIDMQLAMDEVNRKGAEMGLEPLYMGIGINTGDVVASVLGSDIYREFTMIGANVNIAARIEGYTLRGQILLSENTWRHVRNVVETGRLNEVNAKGMRDPLRFYELKAITYPERLALPQRENRKAPRIQIRIPVQYQLLEGKNILPEIYRGEIMDISYGGMLISAPTPINPFADIKIHMSLQPFSRDPVDLYAKALYVQPRDKGAEVGLEFTIIDEATSASVKNFVDNLI